MSSEVDYLADIKMLYRQHFYFKYGKPIGSFRYEISIIQNKMNVKLPKAYTQFLSWMGNDIDGVFTGSDWFLKDLEKNTETLNEFLIENNIPHPHSEKAISFFSHQGYMYAWFYENHSYENPPCFFYSEANDNIKKYDSFTDFLKEDLPINLKL